MKKITLALLALGFGITSWAQQDEIAMRYAETISAEDLKEDLLIIASDSFAGRETGTAGQRMAASYIANHFKKAGLKVQQQKFDIVKSKTDTSFVVAAGTRYEFMEDFYFFPGAPDYKANFTEVLFLGYGIDDSLYSDYKGVEVAGKAIVILNGEPIMRDDNFLLTKSTQPSDWSTKFNKKIAHAESKGVAAVFIVDTEAKKNMKNYKFYLTRESTKLVDKKKDKESFMPALYVSEKMAQDILMSEVKKFEKIGKKIGRKKKPYNELVANNNVDISLSNLNEKATSTNVLGFLEGSEKKDEVIIVTAHYDHIGIVDGEINNGADDDGSGTVTVLELADAFAQAKSNGHGPKRSILFMCVSGEEKGLLGSKFYTDNPIYPLEKTVCNLNIDMVGRVDDKHKKNPDYVYLIGSDKLSTELHSISEEANSVYTQIELDYTYNEPGDPNRFYYRSDHYNFAKNNIPVIFYFNGTHEDYHKPTDTVEKINFEKMEKIGKLVYHTTWKLANRNDRIKVDVENDFEN